MVKHIPEAFRRGLALMTSMLLIAAQLVLPAAALAQDIAALPTVALQWTAADGSIQSAAITPSLYGEQPVYWAIVPEEAIQTGVSIASITGTEDPAVVTYAPAAGTPVAGNATAVDGMVAASIEVYRDGVFEVAYPLYLSTVAMPPYVEEPPAPAGGTVRVSYRYEGGEEFYGYDDTVGAEGKTIAPDAGMVPEGYELIGGETLVTLNADGSTSPNPVVFEVRKVAATSGTVRVSYRYEGGEEFYGYDDTVGAEGKTIAPDAGMVPEGYELIGGETLVTLNADGSTSPNPVVFEVRKAEALPEPEPDSMESQVTFRHVSDGTSIANDTTHAVEAGSHAASEYQIGVEGYTYAGATPETFVVDGLGTPVEVTLTYTKIQTEPEQPAGPVVVEEYNGRYGITTKGSLNLRSAPTTKENNQVVRGVAKDVVIPATQLVEGMDGEKYRWYRINYNGTDCYVRDDCFRLLSQEEAEQYLNVEISVRYVDRDTNEAFFTEKVQCAKGGSVTVSVKPDQAPGYTLTSGSGSVQVTVDANGTATPSEVVFTFAKEELQPVKAEVKVIYVDENQNPVEEPQQFERGPGAYQVTEFAIATPEGFEPYQVNTQQVVVRDDGTVEPDTVIFMYRAKQPATSASQVTFHHVSDGAAITDDTIVTLEAGSYPAAGYQAAVEGYTYANASPETVVVDGTGAALEVTLNYTKNAPVPVASQVTFRHVDADGKAVADDRTISLEPGDYRSESYAMAAPQGYLYANANPESFTVDGTGAPIAVTFTYAVKPAVTAPVTFEYVSESGRAVADPMTVDLPVGENDILEYRAAPEGYTFKSVSSQTVTVSQEGKATPAKVTFTYTENPTTATVEVHYRNAIGDDLPGSPELRQLPAGVHVVQPDASKVPSGYALSSSAQGQTVTVGGDLVAKPNSVSFTCYDAGVTGSVTVNYYDSTAQNKLITTETRKLSPGVHTIQPDDAAVARAGSYERVEMTTNTQVEVKEDGTAIPSVVAFYYKPAENTDYLGYVKVTRQTAMRSSASANGTVVQTLPVDTLLYVAGQHQAGTVTWHSAQTVVGTPSSNGWVNDADVRRISTIEAQALIEEYNQQQQQQAPAQSPGYYITLYNSVPLRTYTNIYAEARYLKKDTVVYVHSQEYDGGKNIWHLTTYDGVTGYVLNGQLRKLTETEEKQYLEQVNGSKPTNPGGNQYDPNGASSYGYVTASGVNFRATPNGTRLKQLNKYAMALVIGTSEVKGVTWYNVNYNGQIGWLHGDYFHQMTLTELTSFVGSPQYQQGITNNAVTVATPRPGTGTPSGNTSSGSATQGNISSVEDWNVGKWQNTGTNAQTSYAPFNPYATPVATAAAQGQYTTNDATVKLYQSADAGASSTTLPANVTLKVTGSVAQNGKNWYKVEYNGQTGYVEADAAITKVSASASPTPTSTFVIGTMIPINYEDETRETQSSAVPWGLIGGAVVVVGGAGGAYAYALNQNKKRKAAAARAAASRRAATAAGTAAGTTAAAGAASPYTRRAAAAPPAAGTKRDDPAKQNMAGTGTAATGYGAVKNPYSSGSITGASGTQNPYSKLSGAIGTFDAEAGASGMPGKHNDAAAGAPGAKPPYSGGMPSVSGAARIPYADGTLPSVGASGVYTGGAGETASVSGGSGSYTAAGPSGTLRGAGSLNSNAGGGAPDAGGDFQATPQTKPSSNPYARPLGMPDAQPPASQGQDGDAAARRRATRMQRYHAAGGDGESDNT